MKHALAYVAISSALIAVGPTPAAAETSTWDGLVLVPSMRLEKVYLRPGAELGRYTKVIVTPAQVSFRKDWLEKYNKSALFVAARVQESQLRETIVAAVAAAQDIFRRAWTKGGYAVVQSVGSDVMEVRAGVQDVSLTTPAAPNAGRMHSFAREAGRATYFLEVRDSTTGDLLGRAVDHKLIGDDLNTWRTAGTNRADFRRQLQRWAEVSVEGLSEIRQKSLLRKN